MAAAGAGNQARVATGPWTGGVGSERGGWIVSPCARALTSVQTLPWAPESICQDLTFAYSLACFDTSRREDVSKRVKLNFCVRIFGAKCE